MIPGSATVRIQDPYVLAEHFVIGTLYKIVRVGTTDFTLVGASNNNVGTSFVATGAGTGNGVVSLGKYLFFGSSNAYATISDGGLIGTTDGTANKALIAPSGGSVSLKRQCEFTIIITGYYGFAGLANTSWLISGGLYPGYDGAGNSVARGFGGGSGNLIVYKGNVVSSGLTIPSVNDVIGFILDNSANTVDVYRNGVKEFSVGSIVAGNYGPCLAGNTIGAPNPGSSASVNCGQSAFAYPVAGAVGFY